MMDVNAFVSKDGYWNSLELNLGLESGNVSSRTMEYMLTFYLGKTEVIAVDIVELQETENDVYLIIALAVAEVGGCFHALQDVENFKVEDDSTKVTMSTSIAFGYLAAAHVPDTASRKLFSTQKVQQFAKDLFYCFFHADQAILKTHANGYRYPVPQCIFLIHC